MTEWWLEPYRSLTSFLDTGGWVLNWIFAAAVVLWMLILERLWFFWRVLPRVEGRVRSHWFQRPERRSFGARRVRGALLGRVNLLMNQTLPTIQVLIAICPLLGLLGTVTGMIEVFDVMAVKGTADARAMAAGVSRATVPTMAGMVVGLSGLFFINRFQSRVRVEAERFGDTLSVSEQPA
ncbi:MotA/TolQ/ExbB proton channel family protein [Flagellatimonas centrodinii]|uniref:MotA/TolQ/ExbB proton channel family protein n=1 Tax=Flagellatimonas centrodinii TaxID=2806210 RepID=UPI001FF066DF|nr:MotA/TolQ/ExbB proton channel family protein [Flagellatimonas centrodinii]ULQ45668.1 MotA/TolQ/ExbB proton channel family protein [Flagellatimonas centrodinii]